MRWWRRFPGGQEESKRRKRRLPERVLAPVAEIVEQGMMVSDVAVRMSVKNKIIVNALADKLPYSKDRVRELVCGALEKVACERERDSKNISLMLGEISSRGRSHSSDTEYHSDDNRTLRHRREVYDLVAKQLRERMLDREYVSVTADSAWQLAWKEIGGALVEKAEHPYYGGGHSADYERNREQRISELIEKDLCELVENSQGGKKKVLRFIRSAKK